ncbi:MAG: penicillin-binding protein 1C [Arenibacterium sp.]
MRCIGTILIAVALTLAASGAARDRFDQWVTQTELPPVLSETSQEMRDRDGHLLRAYQVGSGLWRLAVHPSEVDPRYIDMLIRYEDKRFWTNPGVDALALLRAGGQALWHGRTVSGGSTLTMQVARLLEDGTTGRWSGKLRQMRVALALERRLSKAEILQLYLLHAPFGANVEGVRAASFAWFGKEPKRLTPAEAALLIALPQSPETRRPDRYGDTAKAARNRVLHRLAAQNALSEEQAMSARRAQLPARLRPFPRLAPHLGDWVRGGDGAKNRFDLTLVRGVQQHMEEIAEQAAASAGPRVSVAILVADHTSGEILASVGSAGYGSNDVRLGFVDMTRAVRSPGSLLKPLIYGLAFDQGLAHPETLIHDGPVAFGRYAPRNFDGQFRGDVRVREALQQSLNIPVIRLTDALGPARVTAALERSGAALHIPGGQPGLAIALGGLGLNLHDLVQLYGALAQGGQGRALTVEGLSDAALPRLMSPEAAWHIGDILVGLAPPPGAPSGRIAYKTGTSYGHRDAWAIGYDGAHVIGVWMGRADGTPVPGAFGGDLAAPVLFDAFGRLKPDLARLPPPPPSTLIVSSAQLPAPLARFRPRDAALTGGDTAVRVAFPPDGARLAGRDEPLSIKIRGGVAPFTVLADGYPVLTGLQQREFDLPAPAAGFSTLVVLDRNGQSDRVHIRID